MTTLPLVFLLIAVNVVTPVEVNITESVLLEPRNAFKFEEQLAGSYGLIRFEDQGISRPQDNLDNRFQQFDGTQNTIDEGQRIKFEDQDRLQQYGSQNANDEALRIKFQDQGTQQYGSQSTDEAQSIQFEDIKGNGRPAHQKKKRRRKPKRLPNAQGGYGYGPYPGPEYPGNPGYTGYPGYPGAPVYPGPSAYPGPAVYPGGPFGPGPINLGQRPYQPSYPGQLYKPRPSATTAALSAVIEALSSIAVYDDAQCVPRLLCEAAGGSTVPGAGLFQSVAGLQPLLTLLAAYHGISSSPLFVFGRAVFLGMTSKDNPGTCRYAYPQCPNDPEQLVHYLNNHNGGFFRFFAAPELNQQQGLDQFYNQLSGQNYGLYQPQQPNPIQNQNLQGYGFQQNYQNQHLYQPQQPNPVQNQNLQGYGLAQNYQNQHLNGPSQQFGQYQNQIQQGNNQNQNLQPDYGLAQQQYYNQRPSPYGNGYGLYGQSYPYQKTVDQNKIQKRIQNVRNTAFVNNVSPKWSFPEGSSSNKDHNNVRLGKVLKFPQSNAVTAAEGFTFPGVQSNRQYPIDSIESEGTASGSTGVHDLGFYNQNDHKSGRGFDDGSKYNDGVRILYVVRGNGDPNNPEIVRLAPGQSL